MQLIQTRLAGNAARDAEVKTSKDGKRIVSFALGYSSKQKDGQKTDWYKVTVFENDRPRSKYLCEDAARIKTGANVYVEGSQSLREYKGKDGSTKISIEIIADQIAIIEKTPKAATLPPTSWDDVPF
jgi:single-stranded DNA-binding protein